MEFRSHATRVAVVGLALSVASLSAQVQCYQNPNCWIDAVRCADQPTESPYHPSEGQRHYTMASTMAGVTTSFRT